MDTERADRQLRVIDEVVRLAGELGADVWLRGGWAMDFFLGRLTRDHVDIDLFTWSHGADQLSAALVEKGYRPCPGPPSDLQYDLVKDGLDVSLTLLAQDAAGRVVVAGGPYRGESWPDGMLDAPPGRLGDRVVPIISAAAQIEIKTMMPVWAPGFPRRAKDADDIAWLRAALPGR